MALSKPLSFSDKLSKIEQFKMSSRKIHDEEIEINCVYCQEKAISIELIHHLMGGPNMEYKVINIEDSFECFQYCANNVLDFLKTTKAEILYLKHHTNVTSNILIVVTKQKKTNTTREHPVLMAVIRLSIMTTPTVGFCRHFELKGLLVS